MRFYLDNAEHHAMTTIGYFFGTLYRKISLYFYDQINHILSFKTLKILYIV